MSEWIYPDVIEKLRQSCAEFLDGKLSVSEIQSEIYSAENSIIAIDEKWLRQILFNAENEIELLTFTVDDEQYHKKRGNRRALHLADPAFSCAGRCIVVRSRPFALLKIFMPLPRLARRSRCSSRGSSSSSRQISLQQPSNLAVQLGH